MSVVHTHYFNSLAFVRICEFLIAILCIYIMVFLSLKAWHLSNKISIRKVDKVLSMLFMRQWWGSRGGSDWWNRAGWQGEVIKFTYII